jgi:hypothetical protein
MRKKIGLLVSVFILFALGAGWAAPLQITNSVSSVMMHLTRVVPPSESTEKRAIAAKIDICFPELSCRTRENAAIVAINRVIQNRLLTVMAGQAPTTVEQLMEIFGKAYERSLKEAPELPGAWVLKFESTICHADEELFCLRILQSVFTGGAHPTSNIAYLVFSMKTGDLIPLSALVSKEKMDELTQVAEKHFRLVRNLKPEVTYDRAGFRFKKNRFTLNRNFLVSKSGLTFCFNQGEIAPYARGITELVIPWRDLLTIVDSRGPSGRFLKE